MVERAYPNAWFAISFDNKTPPDLSGQRGDYKTPKDSDLLAPGRYTSVFNLDETGRLGLRLEVDR